MKLGKLAARPNAVTLKFSTYLNTTALPPIPAEFGHEHSVTTWGMLGNDSVGDCVFAGAAHETLLWTTTAGHPASFTDISVLSDYSAVTGYNADNPDSDQGTDVQAAASYRRRVGVLDAAGNRHKVAAYLALEPGNVEELCAATYLFGAVGVGLQFPDTAMAQFDNQEPWTVRRGAKIEGGHYVPVVGRRNGAIDVITWGRVQSMSESFYRKYADEAVVYLSPEYLTGNGLTPEGLNIVQLRADLTAVAQL
ncbi:hypothetical protein GFY24_00640 [Nocardia sp. SYP-A9097]|uniref:hypothetical protein n=1 Tax=Nocardia sp. SYP-A9097 TaxID=2663237 RepID=UPI00129B5E0B|nr:hypothetical protein [Nocardia sp. SYP-A9097]MRH85984.1 hypothetical protein [Nocardia sp. SYP-A9097]